MKAPFPLPPFTAVALQQPQRKSPILPDKALFMFLPLSLEIGSYFVPIPT